MKVKFLSTSVLALLLLAMMATSASAAGRISGGPVKVKGGYSVFLYAVDAKKDSLMINITQGDEANGSAEILNFTGGIRVVVAGGKGSIRGTLGSRGEVDLELADAKVSRDGKKAKNCEGNAGVSRHGSLVGKLRLRLPNGKFVVIRSLPGDSYIGGNLTCEPESDDRPGGDGEGGDGSGEDDRAKLFLTLQEGGEMTSFIATKTELMLTRSSAPKKDRGTTVSALKTAHATGSNLLAVQDGGARATVTAAGPFTGTGLFTASSNLGSVATGPLSGNLRVKLGGAPVIAIAGDDAMLLNGSSPK